MESSVPPTKQDRLVLTSCPPIFLLVTKACDHIMKKRILSRKSISNFSKERGWGTGREKEEEEEILEESISLEQEWDLFS